MQRTLSSEKKKNNFVPVSFGKHEDTGDEGGQGKWDDLIRLKWIRDE